MGSNFMTSGIPEYVKRRDEKNKQHVEIERLEIIKFYNKSMGGVDKYDQLLPHAHEIKEVDTYNDLSCVRYGGGKLLARVYK